MLNKVNMIIHVILYILKLDLHVLKLRLGVKPFSTVCGSWRIKFKDNLFIND